MSRGRAFRQAPAAVTAVLVVLTCSVLAAAPALAAATPGTGSGGTTGSASSVAGHPGFTLVSQSNWVTPAQAGAPATFTLGLSVADAPSGAKVAVSLYKRLITRSGFQATLHSPPSQSDTREIAHTAPVTLSSLEATAGGGASVTLRVSVVPSSDASPAPAAGTPTLDLACTPGATPCTGVYPAVVSLESATGSDLGHFTTYLTYVQGTSAHRLRFAWVVPISGRTSVRAGASDPAHALTPLAQSTASSLEHLIAELHTSGVPVTVEPVPQTVQALAASGTAGQQAVSVLAGMSTHPSVDETVAQTYVPVDLGALAGAGEPTEITAQAKEAAQVLKQYQVSVSSPATWVTTGQVGASTGAGLAQLGAQRVVVPDNQLTAPPAKVTGVRYTGTWASPFSLAFGAKGTVLTAAASDGVLGSQFTADRTDPALAAVKLLADLAMIHFEAPYTTRARGMVAVPPATWKPTRAFDLQLLLGLDNNPVVQPVTLSTYFATVTTADVTRHLQSPSGDPALPASLAKALSTDRLRLTAFDGAVRGAATVVTQLEQSLLAAEADYRGARGTKTAVAAFNRVFGHQLSLIQLSTESLITLTARTGWIPVTVVSSAPYTVEGTLTLSSAKFKFPPSGTGCTSKVHPTGHAARTTIVASRSTSCSLLLDHATNPVRIDVVARTLGDSPVTVVFSVPGLVFARGQLTVRSTATSGVGIALTAMALVVLLAWWARTWWTGRRRRRAAREALARDG